MIQLYSDVPTLAREASTGDVVDATYELELTLNYPPKVTPEMVINDGGTHSPDDVGKYYLASPTKEPKTETIPVKFSPLLDFVLKTPDGSAPSFKLDTPVPMVLDYIAPQDASRNDINVGSGNGFTNVRVDILGGALSATAFDDASDGDNDTADTNDLTSLADLTAEEHQHLRFTFNRTNRDGTSLLTTPPPTEIQTGSILLDRSNVGGSFDNLVGNGQYFVFPSDKNLSDRPVRPDRGDDYAGLLDGAQDSILSFDVELKEYWHQEDDGSFAAVSGVRSYEQADKILLYPRVRYESSQGVCSGETHIIDTLSLNSQPIAPGALAVITGADIEGSILQSQSVFVTRFDSSATVGGSTARDARQQITENGFRLMRGATTKTVAHTVVASDWTSDVLVVKGDATITDALVISGRKTLVVLNGNLKINNNITYANSATDSFGVIVLTQTPLTTYDAAKGNIFVNPSVQHLDGIFFSEGTFASHDGSNIVTSGSEKQLVLVGSLFSRNTLGGSVTSLKTGPNTGKYETPWGVVDTEDDAQPYDLHLVRQFPGGTNCDDTSGSCDANEASFVIRLDGKASELPPPGFESAEVIR